MRLENETFSIVRFSSLIYPNCFHLIVTIEMNLFVRFRSMNYRSTFVLDFELKNFKFDRWKFLVRKSFSKNTKNELFQFLIKFIWNTFKSICSSFNRSMISSFFFLSFFKLFSLLLIKISEVFFCRKKKKKIFEWEAFFKENLFSFYRLFPFDIVIEKQCVQLVRFHLLIGHFHASIDEKVSFIEKKHSVWCFSIENSK